MHPRLHIAVKDHFGSSRAFAAALAAAGHSVVEHGPADLLLIDLDPPKFGYRQMIDRHRAAGAKVLLYPHGAAPALEYDGLYEPYEHVDGRLVIGPGHAEFLRRIEYAHPAPVIGWSLCDMVPFRPRGEVRRVLFAPTHPSGNGTLVDWHRHHNAEIFARLLEGPWELTVRHLGTLEQNGLWEADGITVVQGGMDLAYGEIDATDVVVAGEGTFPHLSIARGVPTVMYAQGYPAMYGTPGEQPTTLLRPERYLDFLRYPFDAADGPLDEILHAAAASERPIADWKRRFVGEPFDPAAFVALVERTVLEQPAPPPIDATRTFTVAGFADEMLERPELLTAFADCFGPDDDATLVLWGPGLEAEALLATVERAVATAGLDVNALPDVLLLPLPGSSAVDRCLADRADALLSEWPPAGLVGELPRFGARDAHALRAAALAPAA
jgi:hypothetical protein